MAPITNTTTGSSGKHGPHKVSLACNFCRSRKRKVSDLAEKKALGGIDGLLSVVRWRTSDLRVL